MYTNSGDPLSLYFHTFLLALGCWDGRSGQTRIGRSGQTFRRFGQSVARAYELLSSMYNFSKGIKMWKMMPKVHLFEHLTEYMVAYWSLNPKSFWTYQDEDLVGEVVQAAKQCSSRCR